jgi:hypothetical protein
VPSARAGAGAVLDAYAVLAFLRDEAGAVRVADSQGVTP